jgi:Ca-activated chloride channel family protein
MKFLSANTHWATFFMVWLVLPTPGFAASLDSKAREGVTHYNREEYDQASAKFQASQLEQPDNTDVAYNLANSLYRLERYEEAVEAYKKALSEKTPSALKQKSYYNMGNAYYRMGYMEESIDAYKKALELNPGDIDSKFNLEWVRKQQEKAQRSGQVGPRDKNILQKQGTSDRPNNPPDPQEKAEKSPGKKTKESRNEQTVKNKPQDKPDSSEKSAVTHTPDPSRGNEAKEKQQAVQDALQEMTQMTPEEAERWLNSLSEDLKKVTRRQMQGKMKDMFADHDKDW